MEEKLDLIIQKLDELLYLAKRIHKDTEPSTENNASEYLLNVLGDVTGDISYARVHWKTIMCGVVAVGSSLGS